MGGRARTGSAFSSMRPWKRAARGDRRRSRDCSVPTSGRSKRPGTTMRSGSEAAEPMTDDRDDLDPGYAWDCERQERELVEEEYQSHNAILDEMDEKDLRALDLSGASDYILWAAAQAYEELERPVEAIALLKRIAASASRHPALSYPDILLRLQDLLKDSGDYE